MGKIVDLSIELCLMCDILTRNKCIIVESSRKCRNDLLIFCFLGKTTEI